MELHSILVTDCSIAFRMYMKTVQEFPDPSFRVLVMQYIQHCGSGHETNVINLATWLSVCVI